MPRTSQPQLFETESQSDLFGAEPVPAYRPDPDKVRSRLHKILAEARAAQTLPWERTTVSLYRTIFPQMTNWLPRTKPRNCASSSRRRSHGWKRPDPLP